MESFILAQWLKALHVIFMVAWFAGIFYLPRLFVYHAESTDKNVHEQFKVMERRLLYFVTPFALFTLLTGIGLIFIYGSQWFALSSWLHLKLLLLALLFAYHGYCFHLLKVFREDKNTRSSKWYRVFNEAPVLLLFAIVILAVIKPSLW